VKKLDQEELVKAERYIDGLEGIGPDGLVILHDDLPFNSTPETVQEAYDVSFETNKSVRGQRPVHVVFRKSQVKLVYANKTYHQHFEAICRVLLRLAQDTGKVTFVLRVLKTIVDRVTVAEDKKAACLKALPGDLFGIECFKNKPGQLIAAVNALAAAGEIDLEEVTSFAALCHDCPKQVIKYLKVMVKAACRHADLIREGGKTMVIVAPPFVPDDETEVPTRPGSSLAPETRSQGVFDRDDQHSQIRRTHLLVTILRSLM